jgi:hypothetical protein
MRKTLGLGSGAVKNLEYYLTLNFLIYSVKYVRFNF